jgi:hypothetical protein
MSVVNAELEMQIVRLEELMHQMADVALKASVASPHTPALNMAIGDLCTGISMIDDAITDLRAGMV